MEPNVLQTPNACLYIYIYIYIHILYGSVWLIDVFFRTCEEHRVWDPPNFNERARDWETLFSANQQIPRIMLSDNCCTLVVLFLLRSTWSKLCICVSPDLKPNGYFASSILGLASVFSSLRTRARESNQILINSNKGYTKRCTTTMQIVMAEYTPQGVPYSCPQ